MRVILAATIAIFALIEKAPAHEFWIDVIDYSVAPGDAIAGDIRVGEEFEGAPFAFIPRSFTRFDVTIGDETLPVERRLGDMPALMMEGLPEGLAIVAHESANARLTYTEWERFLRFAAHKDFGDIAAVHDARGLSRERFIESYSRHAKALIAVGEGAGQDRIMGLTTEIVALSNPYTDDLSDGLAVQVYYDGAIRPDVQVELFDRAPDGTVTVTLHRTNADGIALLPVEPGHEYLADHVVLAPLEAANEDMPVWQTYWAALTFAVPG